MTPVVLCFCGTTYYTDHPMRGVCPYCDTALPADEPPDTVPVDWTANP